MRKKSLYCLVLIALMFLTSCGAWKIINQHEFTFQLAVEAATARMLHDKPAWKVPAIQITDKALALIDSNATVDLQGIEKFIKDNIQWGKLLPEEQALLSVLISEVRARIEDSLRAQKIEKPELQIVEVKKVILWINQTAKRTI